MPSIDPRSVFRTSSRWLDRSAELSRRRAARQNQKFRSQAAFIAQCAGAAGVAYLAARDLFDVPLPMFAPVAAILTVGMSYGQRLKRAVEITVGVAIGVLVAELFVMTVGMGVWQVIALVAIAMSVAAWLGASPLMINQAGIQGMVVALLAGQQDVASGRWLEAMIGCAVGLLFATLVPSSVLRRPRIRTAALLTRLADLHLTTAEAIEQKDDKLARENLEEARSMEKALTTLRGYADDSIDISTYVPWYRRRNQEMRTVAKQLGNLDRAIRNTRVLMRRSTVSSQLEQDPPASYIDMLRALSRVTDVLAEFMRTGEEPDRLRPMMHNLTQRASRPAPDADMTAEVLRAQVRSIIVDYNMMLGDDYTGALKHLRLADDQHIQDSKDSISAILDQMEPETHAIPAVEFTETGILPVLPEAKETEPDDVGGTSKDDTSGAPSEPPGNGRDGGTENERPGIG